MDAWLLISISEHKIHSCNFYFCDYSFGAGSLTKYASKYQTKWAQGYYDSAETGEKVRPSILFKK